MTWSLPPTDLLTRSETGGLHHYDPEPLLRSLALLGATGNVADISVAPQAVRVEVQPCPGVLMRSYRGLEPDLMQMLSASSVRVQAPTPGRTTVGVELPREDRATVYLGDVAGAAHGPLSTAVGVDMTGVPMVLDIAALPHLLVAGRSGGGKSGAIHALICSLLGSYSPDDLEIVLVDTKMTELSRYEGLPHASHVIYDADTAIDVLWGMVESMMTTYRCMRRYGARTLDDLNVRLALEGELPIPRRLLVCDELGDLMMAGKGRVESAVVRLGQLGRAAGFHLVLATQSPRAQIVSGLIKANLPGRIALATASSLDSRVILDQNGAESLLGRGDALYDDGISGHLQRFQVGWASSEDIDTIVSWWSNQTLALTQL